jgi:hypothetical protein
VEVFDHFVHAHGEAVKDLRQAALESLFPTVHQFVDHGSCEVFVEVTFPRGAVEDAVTTNSGFVCGPEQASLIEGCSPSIRSMYSFLSCGLRCCIEVSEQLCIQRYHDIPHGVIDRFHELLFEFL